MAGLSLSWTGLREARAAVSDMAKRASAWGNTTIGVGATAAYAAWIETGRYASGRPGRTTPIHYLRRAQQDARPDLLAAAAASMVPGGPSVDQAAEQVGAKMRQLAQQYVTVKSGNLRDSIFSRRGSFR